MVHCQSWKLGKQQVKNEEMRGNEMEPTIWYSPVTCRIEPKICQIRKIIITRGGYASPMGNYTSVKYCKPIKIDKLTGAKRREWMACWLLGWWLLVMKWIIPEISLRLAPVRSASKNCSFLLSSHPFLSFLSTHPTSSKAFSYSASSSGRRMGSWRPRGEIFGKMRFEATGEPWDCHRNGSMGLGGLAPNFPALLLSLHSGKLRQLKMGSTARILTGSQQKRPAAPALLSKFDAQLYPVCHKKGGYHGIPQNNDSDGKMMTNQGIRAPWGQINPETSLVTSNFSSGFSFGNFQPVMWHCLKQCQVVLRYISGVVPNMVGFVFCLRMSAKVDRKSSAHLPAEFLSSGWA